jgi:FKBP-type peptidyl-prolyl cis-trans isomerase
MIRSIFFAAGILLIAAACNTSSSKEGKTASGFKYVFHNDEEGATPVAGEYVYFQIMMSNGDSILFDSHTEPEEPLVLIPSVEELAGQRTSPVLEALQVMSEGDSLSVYYPIDSLGPNRPAGFEDAEFVVYHIAMKQIKSAQEYEEDFAAEQAANEAVLETIRGETQALIAEYKDGSLSDRLQKTESGLEYVVLEEGNGEMASPGETVAAHYYGVLMDGTEFDNSYSRGSPFSFPLGAGRVIPGWDEGFGLFKSGTKAVLFIPSDLGYGENGAPPVIPPNAQLVFHVDIL